MNLSSRRLVLAAVLVSTALAAPAMAAAPAPRRVYGKGLVNMDVRLLEGNRPNKERVRALLSQGRVPQRSVRDERDEHVEIEYPTEATAVTKRTRYGSKTVYNVENTYRLSDTAPAQWAGTTTVYRRGRVKYQAPSASLDYHVTGKDAKAFPFESARRRGRIGFTVSGSRTFNFTNGPRTLDIGESHGEVWYDNTFPPRYSDSGTFWKFRLSLKRGDGRTDEIDDGFYLPRGTSIETVLSHVNWRLTDSIGGLIRAN